MGRARRRWRMSLRLRELSTALVSLVFVGCGGDGRIDAGMIVVIALAVLGLLVSVAFARIGGQSHPPKTRRRRRGD